jgi:hypothetical protein
MVKHLYQLMIFELTYGVLNLLRNASVSVFNSFFPIHPLSCCSTAHSMIDIVDVKPANLEELTEVITSATFHPKHCHIMVYSSSRGSIRLGDLRDSALCDQHSKCMPHIII